jgi:hypothetical protein
MVGRSIVELVWILNFLDLMMKYDSLCQGWELGCAAVPKAVAGGAELSRDDKPDKGPVHDFKNYCMYFIHRNMRRNRHVLYLPVIQ